MTTTIFVCDTCAYARGEKIGPDGRTGGEMLAAEVERLAEGSGLDVRRQSCLMGCDRHCNTAITAEGKDQGNILIAITENGQIWIDRRQVDPRALRANIERLHGENPQGSIVVQADQKSQNHLLIQVMDAAKAAGVAQIAIAADAG